MEIKLPQQIICEDVIKITNLLSECWDIMEQESSRLDNPFSGEYPSLKKLRRVVEIHREILRISNDDLQLFPSAIALLRAAKQDERKINEAYRLMRTTRDEFALIMPRYEALLIECERLFGDEE